MPGYTEKRHVKFFSCTLRIFANNRAATSCTEIYKLNRNIFFAHQSDNFPANSSPASIGNNVLLPALRSTHLLSPFRILSLIKSISGFRGTIGGRSGENLTPQDIVECTAAFGQWILNTSGKRSIVVGRDGRISGEVVSAVWAFL